MLFSKSLNLSKVQLFIYQNNNKTKHNETISSYPVTGLSGIKWSNGKVPCKHNYKQTIIVYVIPRSCIFLLVICKPVTDFLFLFAVAYSPFQSPGVASELKDNSQEEKY